MDIIREMESTLTTGVKAGGSSMTVRSRTAQQVDGNAARVSKDASPALTPLCPSGVKRMEEVKGTAHKRDNSSLRKP